MKLCDRCRVAGCLLNYGGKACKNARKQNCPDVVFTNADRVREMNDEELAKFMLSSDGAAYCKNNDRDSTCYLKGRDGMSGRTTERILNAAANGLLFLFLYVMLDLCWIGAECVFEGIVHESRVDGVVLAWLCLLLVREIEQFERKIRGDGR